MKWYCSIYKSLNFRLECSNRILHIDNHTVNGTKFNDFRKL